MPGPLHHLTSHLPLRPDGFFGSGSVELTPPIPGSSESPVRRLAVTSSELVERPMPNINTVPDVLAHAVCKYGSQNAIAYRDVIKVHHEEKELSKYIDGQEVTEKKTWKLYELTPYKFVTYEEFGVAVREVRDGLLGLGMGKEEVVNVYSQTGLSWQLINHACASISTPIATAYDTLGVDGLAHSLNEPDCAAIFTNADLLATLSQVVARTPKLKHVFFDGPADTATLESIRSARGDINVMHIDDLRAFGRSQNKEEMENILKDRQPNLDTLACIMYTSGSTGNPKGVMITHGNLLASVSSVSLIFGPHIPAGDIYLAYLPLAHVLEYIVELCALYVGITIGYARPKTLTDAGVKNCKGDLAELRPHIMFGVPSVWEAVRKGIMGKVNGSGSVKRTMFNAAMEAKRRNVPVFGGLGESVGLSKVREATGGRLKFAMNGGAPVSRETQEFLSVAVMPMMEGYGMTESCGMCTLLPPEYAQFGSVGLPGPSIEIKLLDVPSSNYRALGDVPQGEICIRGPSVFKGYYKRPDLNVDPTVWTEDGWFRTGDVGRWNEDGTLSLIDRIKNLVKMQNGEFIALEKLESVYKSSEYVSNLCIHVEPGAAFPIAILSLHEANVRHAVANSFDAAISRLEGAPMSTLCTCPYVRHLVLNSVVEAGRRSGLKGVEMIRAVVLTKEEWSPENGMVSAAMKVRRGEVARFVGGKIKDAYASAQ